MTESTKLWKALIFEHRVPWRYQGRLLRNLSILNILKAKINVACLYDGLGDQLLTEIVCKNIKKRFPKLRINCIIKNKELFYSNRYIDSLETVEPIQKVFSYDYLVGVEYDKIIKNKMPNVNILKPTFDKLGMTSFEYEPDIFLSKSEIASAKDKLKKINKPILAISTTPGERVKEWEKEKWEVLINLLKKEYHIIHLGDVKEPVFKEIKRFAGKLKVRDSIALLSQAKAFIGPVGFLMHAARAVNIPSVIIYGGRETPQNSGYKQNQNIYIKTECSPCWIHTSTGGKCPNNMKCMKIITPEMVYEVIKKYMIK